MTVEAGLVLGWIVSRLGSQQGLSGIPVYLNAAPVEAPMPLFIVDLDPSSDTYNTDGSRVVVDVNVGVRLLLLGSNVSSAVAYGPAIDAALTLTSPVVHDGLMVHSSVRRGAFVDRLFENGIWITRVHTEWTVTCSEV